MILPTDQEIQSTLLTLLDMPVVAKGCPALMTTASMNAAVALYTLDAGAPEIVGICEAPLVYALGAALTRIPPKVVVDIVKTGANGQACVENAREVFNVLGGLLNKPGRPHVLFHPEKLTLSPLANYATAVIQARERVDFSITVGPYAPGRLLMLAVAPGWK